jgi:hypothetical protein
MVDPIGVFGLAQINFLIRGKQKAARLYATFNVAMVIFAAYYETNFHLVNISEWIISKPLLITPEN